jgi:hypothetical protein
MISQAHTPETSSYRCPKCLWALYDGLACQCKHCEDFGQNVTAIRMSNDEVFARMHACVRACEGIEDPAELRAQRDDLLAVAKRALKFFDNQKARPIALIGRSLDDTLRDLIARAEGSQP